MTSSHGGIKTFSLFVSKAELKFVFGTLTEQFKFNNNQGRRQGFKPVWADIFDKIQRKARKKFSFAHPGFLIAHPAIRNGCPLCPP